MNNLDDINLIKPEKKLRYVIVYDKLFKMITDGVLPSGSKLPSEPLLAQNIGVSRTTLRQALALLKDDGLIKNVHGKGNFITNSFINKNKVNNSIGLEHLDNPTYRCIEEKIDYVEIDFHIEPSTDYINHTLKRKYPVCILVDRWYKSKDNVVAYCFSLLPVETVSLFNVDLNDKTKLLKFLDFSVYNDVKNSTLDIKYSTSASFSSKKHSLIGNGECHLIQEALYNNNKIIIFNKHYLPTEISSIIVNCKK